MTETVMVFLRAFLTGGAICVIGQLIIDVWKRTPAHMMTLLVVAGAILGGLGWYEPLIKFAGAGVTVTATFLGYSLVLGALNELERDGYMGIITGIFDITSGGISAAIIFSFLAAVIVRPKG